MSKLTDLIIEQIEQGQNALKREHNIRREHHKITDPFAIMALEEHDRLVIVMMCVYLVTMVEQ